MVIRVLTACDGKHSTIEGLFGCLEKQTVLPDQIVLLVYTTQTKEQFEKFTTDTRQGYPGLKNRLQIISSHNSAHQPGRFHGYDRGFLVEWSSGKFMSCRTGSGISGSGDAKMEKNYSIDDREILKQVQDDVVGGVDDLFTLMIDIDNEVEVDFIESLMQEYNMLEQEETRDFLLAPTVMRRKTDRVQSQGIAGYSFLIPKYRFASFTAEQSPQQVMMMGANCLLGPTRVFQQIGFDPLFAYSYEDIDFTYRLTQSGVSLYVTATTVTYHMESERSKLDHKLIGSPRSAYYRMRNYILFVQKNATRWQKVQAYGFSIWGLYAWFVLNALVYGGDERRKIVGGLSRGMLDGVIS